MYCIITSLYFTIRIYLFSDPKLFFVYYTNEIDFVFHVTSNICKAQEENY